VYHDGDVFFLAGSNTVWRLTAAHGTVVHPPFDTQEGPNLTSPAIREGNVPRLYCGSGEDLWEITFNDVGFDIMAAPYDTDCTVRSSASVAGTRFYIGDGSELEPHGLSAFPDMSDPDWTYNEGEEWTCATPAVKGDAIYMCGGSGPHKVPDVYCLLDDDETYSVIWTVELGAEQDFGIPGSPAIADGMVFVPLPFGEYPSDMFSRLYCLSAETGAQLCASFDLGSGKVFSSPAICDGKVYIGTEDGRMLCFGQVGGAARSDVRIEDTAAQPVQPTGPRALFMARDEVLRRRMVLFDVLGRSVDRPNSGLFFTKTGQRILVTR
jgi:outer membrane protein assembly factor BamB